MLPLLVGMIAKRKIMQMSNSSFIVTLPKDWAELNELNKGEEIEFQDIGNDLVIKGKKEKELEINLDLSKMSYDLIWRHLICSYRKGANKLTIKYGDKENLGHIMKFVKDLTGWAIVKQDNEKVIIKDLVSVENTDFDDTFRKVFLLVLDISQQTLDGLKKQDKDALENIKYFDYNINKFSNLCLRILNLKGCEYNRTNSLYKIISTLEEIADEYRKLAIFYKPAKLSDDLVGIFEKVNKLLEMFFEVFYKFKSKNGSKKLIEFYSYAEELLAEMKHFKRSGLTETRTFATLFTIFHLIKSLSEENLVLSL